MTNHLCQNQLEDLVWDIPERLIWICDRLMRSGLLQKCYPVEVSWASSIETTVVKEKNNLNLFQ
jgi:hypothetical protein